MRQPLIVGNHKMNYTWRESQELITELKPLVAHVKEVEVAVCPPFTSLMVVAQELSGTPIKLGAQNMHQGESGAYTGEISASMLKALGCQYVILGHSERRHYFKESDDVIHAKTRAAVTAGLRPIICVGETLDQRQSEQTREVIERQLVGALQGLAVEELADVVVAYEPVWAIGTGHTASPEQANEVCGFIRGLAAKLAGTSIASNLRILYGGSVKPHNIKELMACSDIDGALVGGASLKAQDFAAIVRYYES